MSFSSPRWFVRWLLDDNFTYEVRYLQNIVDDVALQSKDIERKTLILHYVGMDGQKGFGTEAVIV